MPKGEGCFEAGNGLVFCRLADRPVTIFMGCLFDPKSTKEDL